jgi:hypothetical protein
MEMQSQAVHPKSESTVVLLRHLIDYAGLFPPASLRMTSAVANYDSYLRSEYKWMLGRFIVPATQLEEFADAIASLPGSSHGEKSRWGLSVLLGTDVRGDLARIHALQSRKLTDWPTIRPEVQSVEGKTAGPEEIEHLSGLIPRELETYFEIPCSAGSGSDGATPGRSTAGGSWSRMSRKQMSNSAASSGMRDSINAIAACGRRAKIRTGGETADKFPTPEAVIEFIESCVGDGVAFKATAGLHHPLRSSHPLTYQVNSPSGMMHGFLNVFLAAAFVRAGMESALAVELLEANAIKDMHFEAQGVTWQGHRLSLGDLAAARHGFSVSFGSCSFTEPVEDLRALHLL